jgi:WD40 repeat protein
MKWRIGRVVLLLAAILIAFFAVWTFWVPTHEPGGQRAASISVPCSLVWSPDGDQLLYRELRIRDSTPGVHLVEADGSGTRLLVGGHRSFPVGWLDKPRRPVVIEWHGTQPNMEMRLLSIDPDTGNRKDVRLPFQLPLRCSCSVAPSLSRAAVWRLDKEGQMAALTIVSSKGVSGTLWQLPVDQVPLWAYWAPDAERLAFPMGNAMASNGGGIAVFDIAAGTKTELLRTKDYLGGLAWSDLDLPAAALEGARSLCARGITGRSTWMEKPTHFFAHWEGRHIRSIVYSIRVRDSHVRELLRLPRGNTVGDLAWSPTGGKLAAVCHSNDTIRIFDIPKAKPGDWRRAKEILP